MTPGQHVQAVASARDQVANANTRLRDAEAAARPLKEAFQSAAAVYDRADGCGDPFATAQAKEAYQSARGDHNEAAAHVERAEASLRGAQHKLSELEAVAEQTFNNGARELRQKVRSAQEELAAEWDQAAAALREVGGRIAALATAVPDFSMKANPMALTSAPMVFGGMGLERTVDAVIVPRLGTGGLDDADRLVSRASIITAMPQGAYGDLSADHESLRKLGRLIYELGARHSSAA